MSLLYSIAFIVLINIIGITSDWPDPVTQSEGAIWPKPQKIQATGKAWKINLKRFKFVVVPSSCNILNLAVERYRKRLRGVLKRAIQVRSDEQDYLQQLEITVGVCSSSSYPQLGMDESYKLNTNASIATIQADRVWGALRGLESFAHLFFVNKGGEINVRAVDVDDFPRFPHRGVLLDTSRHYLSVNLLKANIELMTQNKFNTFHWHMVDIQSFPYQSKVFPDLVKGAYSPNHIYTMDQIKDVIEYARLRGIRVVAEFDTPGHMNSWGVGMPDLLAKCFDSQGKEVNSDRGVVDMTKEENWDVLLALFKELFELFPDNYMHLGGDEVEYWSTNCWLNNKNVQEFMKTYNLANVTDLEAWYYTKLINVLKGRSMAKYQKNFLIWEEVLKTDIKYDKLIVHVWKGPALMAEATSKGYFAILSSCWYLNYISDSNDWLQYYSCDPQNFNGTDTQKRLVLGGEAAMWGEWVDDSNTIPRLWPRASAVGERLWSSRTTNNTEEAWPRLYEMQCRMASQGYPVQPADGPGYCAYEYQSNLPI